MTTRVNKFDTEYLNLIKISKTEQEEQKTKKFNLRGKLLRNNKINSKKILELKNELEEIKNYILELKNSINKNKSILKRMDYKQLSYLDKLKKGGSK